MVALPFARKELETTMSAIDETTFAKHRVIALATPLFGGVSEAVAWLFTAPFPGCDRHTPADLVEVGRTHEVVDHLHHLRRVRGLAA
jgi:uncharacterized protein (DUF2384 family)